jgi:hypothetical protein
MMRYISAVIVGLFAGAIVMFMPVNVALGITAATAVAAALFCEAAIMHKLEELEKQIKK